MKEYHTTFGTYRPAGRYLGEDESAETRADQPEPPKGDGWRMVGAAAADGLLFWFWERNVENADEDPPRA